MSEEFGKNAQGEELEQLSVNTIRTLAIDGVQKANSGHPGLPMGCADFAYVLWTEFLKFNPDDPSWPDRDRFVLSAGHGSMLLYAMLHLTGYDVTMEDLQNFRQYGSRTPGHPEFGYTCGVDATTGPLGQGISNAVGMAIAEEWLAATFNSGKTKVVDHYTYGICSDGDLMEGVAAEAASLAGHLGLGKMIFFYDDNHISIEGDTELAYTDNVRLRFEGYNWHVQQIDGQNRDEIRKALREAQHETQRPSIIIGRTTIAFGSPNMAGSEEAHGSPLGEKEVALTKKNLGWPEDRSFVIPDPVRKRYHEAADKGREACKSWRATLDALKKSDPEKGKMWDEFWNKDFPEERVQTLIKALPKFEPGKEVATRKSAGMALEAMLKELPNLIGGSADLAPSTNTLVKAYGEFSRENRAGRNFHFGVREHGMGAVLNGMCYHGGVRPFGATFFVFSDYMRPPIRLAALSHLNPIYVFTHDSIFVGEDGPTHEPVEQLAALRAIPNMTVIRPADAAEAGYAWIAALQTGGNPVALILTRQNLRTIDRMVHGAAEGLLRGAYHLIGEGETTILATGSEVNLALDVRKLLLEQEGIDARVVSMPSWELFERQPEWYKRQVLGAGPKIAIEAGIRQGWDYYIGREGLFVGLDHFGASAPAKRIAEEYGFTPRKVVDRHILPWLRGQQTVSTENQKKNKSR